MCLRARLFSPLMGARRFAPRPQGGCCSSPGPTSHAWPASDFSACSSGEFRVSSDSLHTDLSYLRTTVQLASFCPQGLDQKRQQPEAQGSLCPRGNSQPMGQALGKMPQPPSPQAHGSGVCKKLLRGPQQHRTPGPPFSLLPPASGDHLPKKPLATNSCPKHCFLQRETLTL